MSKQYLEIKFVTLGHLSTEISVFFLSITPWFFSNFSFIYYGYIKCHEYSNKFVFISAHKIRVLCLSIALIPSLLL